MIQVENEPIPDYQKIAKELEPLIEFIDFRRIKGSILVDIIEPLEIVPTKIILNVYRQSIKSNNFNLNDIRGIPILPNDRINESDYIWDNTACGSKLIIEDNGKVVRAPKSLGSWRSVRAKLILENNGIYEWDVIIEKACNASWIGVASENLNYEDFAGDQPIGWVLGSGGYCRNFGMTYGLLHNEMKRYKKERDLLCVHTTIRRLQCAILAAKQVSNDAFKTLLKRLPTLDQIENSIQVESEPITDHQKIAKELEPLVEFIDFRRIKGSILVDIIEPLEIVPAKIILNIYRHNTKSNNFNLNDIRGTLLYRTNESDCVWDETACGSKLIIEDNGKVVRAPKSLGSSWRSVRAKMILENNGIYEWDVIIEKACNASWIGVASENLNYEKFAGNQLTGWVLASSGYYCNSGNYIGNYCPGFGDAKRDLIRDEKQKKYLLGVMI
ncbi:hypothetical protein GLOIN_2v1472107 [Rhizophagus irregularis DAOM 181602=DAOM 197198]|nr:hypothetical protein GLOIN_2v1472107 [Rhizophagus irregularis DAOM 181602=DAOM 197198]